MLLYEQLHKNLYRSYFCGHQKDYDKSKAYFKIDFYTTSPVYALFYTKSSGIVSEYKLKHSVNIFNARCKTDFDKLHKYVNDNHIPISYNDLERLKDDDWSFILNGDKKRQELLNIIFSLGYDGFFNYEYTKSMKSEIECLYDDIPDTDNNPAIGLLGSNVFIKVKDYNSNDELEQLDEIADYKENEKEKVERNYKYLRYNFGEETAYSGSMAAANKWLTLSVDEVMSIVNDTALNYKEPTVEELKEKLKFFESTHRPGFDEIAKSIRERIKCIEEVKKI